MSHIIVLATSKGGAGKTTLTRSLAGHWMNLGHKVAIVDADPQGSIANRHDSNGEMKKVKVFSDPEETISQTIFDLVEQEFSKILVDTGGFRNRTTIMALIQSSLCLIPLKASADDVSGAIETYNLIKEINETPERQAKPIKYRMVLTMTQAGTVISRHVRNELGKMGYPLLESELYSRVSYPEASINGLPPNINDPDGPAGRDIAKIVNEINSVLSPVKKVA